jgi:hypothetical protein
MKQSRQTESKPMQALRRIAMRLPEAQEGMVCQKAAFKAGNKAFFFMGMDDTSYNTMLKLRDSLPEATKLAAKQSDRYGVGAHGWVSATFDHGQSPPPDLFERWIDESYRLLVPKKLVALLPVQCSPTAGPTKAASKKAG